MERTLVKLSCFIFLIASVQCNAQSVDSKIVMIGVDTLSRPDIAKMIRGINALNPKVVAIDLNFSDHKVGDGDLVFALDDCENLVMSSVIRDFNGDNVNYKRFDKPTISEFLINAKTGFTNAILEDDGYGTLKRFYIRQRVLGEYENHFAVQVSLFFDYEQASAFVKGNRRVIDVDYKAGKRKFKVFSSIDVLSGKLTREDIEGKILMLGFLGPGNEDKFFTPLNNHADINKPDMYGLEYLANIVAQILEYGRH